LRHLFPAVIVRKPRNSTDIPSAFFLHSRKNSAHSIASYFVYATLVRQSRLTKTSCCAFFVRSRLISRIYSLNKASCFSPTAKKVIKI